MSALAAALGIVWAAVAAATVRHGVHVRRLHALVASERRPGLDAGRRASGRLLPGPGDDRVAGDAWLRIDGRAGRLGDAGSSAADSAPGSPGFGRPQRPRAGGRRGPDDDLTSRRSSLHGPGAFLSDSRSRPGPAAEGHPAGPSSGAGRARRWPGIDAGLRSGSPGHGDRGRRPRGDGSPGPWWPASTGTPRLTVGDDTPGPRRPTGAWPGAGVATEFGRLLRRAARRPPDPAADRRVGAAAIATAILVPVAAPLATVPLAWAAAAPLLAARRQARAHEAAAVDQLPDVTDLLILTTTAGLPVSASIEAIGARPGGPFGEGLAEAAAHVRLGGATADGLQCLVDAAGAVARPLVDALADHDRYGAPLRPTLERVAVEARMRRRRRAEEDARRLPVTLLFPLVLTTLPAFFLLAIVPLLVGSLGAISP